MHSPKSHLSETLSLGWNNVNPINERIRVDIPAEKKNISEYADVMKSDSDAKSYLRHNLCPFASTKQILFATACIFMWTGESEPETINEYVWTQIF